MRERTQACDRHGTSVAQAGQGAAPQTTFEMLAGHYLLLIWLCFLVRGFFYALILPLWEGYDEYAHFAFVQHVATHRNLPAGTETRISREIERSVQLAPMPWTVRLDLCSPPCVIHDDYWRLSALERARRQDELRSLPVAWRAEPAGTRLLIYEAQQPPLYYWLLAYPLRAASALSLPGRVFLLRSISVALASLAIPLGWLLARQILGDGAALGIVALITAMPEFILNISRVGNDSLAAVLFTVVVLFAGSAGGRGSWLLLGIILGLGLLTKAYFLTALPALCLIWFWQFWRSPDGRRRVLIHGVLCLAVAAALSGWWYWRTIELSSTLSGEQHAASAAGVSSWAILRQIGRVDWRSVADSAFLSHIWFGNWSFLQVRSWMYHFFGYVALAAALGLMIRIIRRDDARVLPLAAFYGFFLLGLAWHALLLFTVHGSSSCPGWYIYCLVAPEVILAVLGLSALVPARAARWLLPAGVFCFTALEMYATHWILIPYYTGLIAHKPTGAVAAFHMGQLRELGIGGLLQRVAENKPVFVGPVFLAAAWLVFLAASAGLVIISVRSARKRGYNPIN